MDLSWLFGFAKKTFFHSQNDVLITLEDGSKQSLSELCKEVIPPCRVNPFLFNGHLQTMWNVTAREGPSVIYKRKIFKAEDSRYTGEFAVDFVVHKPSKVDSRLPPRTTYYTKKELQNIGSDDTRPMLVALHGLSGGSHEAYLREVLAPLVEGQVWEACVVNSRGCAKSKITSGFLYNARATWDVRQTINWLREKYPNRPLFGIGFSLGANILTIYTAEEGPKCPLKAAVLCSNPWNLDVSALALQRTWVGSQIYSKVMCTSMKELVLMHQHEIAKKTKVDFEEVKKIKFLHEFDRVVQCPTWGYPTEGAYYRDASSIDSILAVKIPTLAINAEDDPISTYQAIPFSAFKQNPYAVLCATSIGGHLSWFKHGGEPWFATASIAFLKKMAEDVDLESIVERDPHPSAKHNYYEPMRRPFRVDTLP